MSLLTTRVYLSAEAKQILARVAAESIMVSPQLASAYGVLAAAAKITSKAFRNSLLMETTSDVELPEAQVTPRTKADWVIYMLQQGETVTPELYNDLLAAVEALSSKRTEIEGSSASASSDELMDDLSDAIEALAEDGEEGEEGEEVAVPNGAYSY